MDRLRQTDRNRVAWLASRHPLELIHFPPSPKKFLHSYLGCLKSSWSRFKSFYFFRKKLRPLEGFDQMSAFWSMFWFKPFRNFLRKITIFRNFDQWSEILSMLAGRPLSQGVCPPLLPGCLIVTLFAVLCLAILKYGSLKSLVTKPSIWTRRWRRWWGPSTGTPW